MGVQIPLPAPPFRSLNSRRRSTNPTSKVVPKVALFRTKAAPSLASLPSGTVTFLFTDIEGSTTLLQRLGDRRYAEVLEEQRRLLRFAFIEGNGQEIDTQGDAFLVAFSRARDAMATAVAAQQSLMKHAWPDGASIQVRMGIHTGEPISNTDRYVGLDVHRAARIGAAGHGGQILLSDAVRGLAARDLPPGVSLRDLGTHRLKDLREPEHLFQVVHPDLPTDFPAVKSLDVLPNNLPVQLTSFIGREHEKAEVRNRLSATRFVTLTGSGGAGKTRLALQVAAEALEEFPDGVWLVELAALSDPNLVPKAVASALGVPEQPSRMLTETLADALRGKSVLIILDNCEHLVAACAHLTTALLRTCPHLRILATSREALGVTGETTWRVPSLSLPDPQRLPPLDHLKEYEAVRLFIDRAVANEPQFAVTSSNALAVAQVCHRLDGIPLALELAAARVKVLAVEQIAARLDDRFRLLTGGSRTALPRQQTLQATMDWSYYLLSDQERTALRSLSVFAGGWTLEAAEVVCAGKGVEASKVLDLLTQLVDKSLVAVETQGGEARYRFLETVRRYGLDRLLESGETGDVRRRHRDWFLGFAERAEPKLRGPEQKIWLERLEMEHDNLRAALEWSRAEGNAEAGVQLAGALFWFWFAHGHWSEGRAWLEEAILGSSDASSSALTKALQGAAYLAWGQGDYGRATALSEKGLALCRERGDKEGVGRFLIHLGLAAGRQGNYGRMAALCENGLALCRERGDKWVISWALMQLGAAARFLGDYERAEVLHKESIALAREVGDKYRIAFSLRGLGFVAFDQGDYGRAAALCKESLVFCKEVEDRRVTAECLAGLAGVACAQGHYVHAARLIGAGEALFKAVGYQPHVFQQAYIDQIVAATRARLGEPAYAAAWAEGQAMTLEHAIESALSDT